MKRRHRGATIGLVATVITAMTMAFALENTSARRVYLPGRTTDGHYQIELSCESCHSEPFSGTESLQAACVRCHGDELREANDSHPEKKFTDPRNADRTARLDARFCTTCHREHRPELVAGMGMGLSLPDDYCGECHREIAAERPSHEGLGFDTCANAGCHNFHDNRALYEDFLAKHLDEPASLDGGRNEARSLSHRKGSPPVAPPVSTWKGIALSSAEAEAWAKSAHAASAVECTACHEAHGSSSFDVRVGMEACKRCHSAEYDGFTGGRHGMRIRAGLDAMRVADARLPMKASAQHATVTCNSCHSDHGFDTRAAAVDACLGCHDDTHSRAYKASPHYVAWSADPTGRSGASCATCHLPRVRVGDEVRVQHNQNDTLRPNEKMIRAVCQNCHGAGFAIDALADAPLVERNFDGPPSVHVKSLAMVRARSTPEPDKER